MSDKIGAEALFEIVRTALSHRTVESEERFLAVCASHGEGVAIASSILCSWAYQDGLDEEKARLVKARLARAEEAMSDDCPLCGGRWENCDCDSVECGKAWGRSEERARLVKALFARAEEQVDPQRKAALVKAAAKLDRGEL